MCVFFANDCLNRTKLFTLAPSEFAIYHICTVHALVVIAPKYSILRVILFQKPQQTTLALRQGNCMISIKGAKEAKTVR